MKKKCVDDSKTEQFRLLKYEDINGANRLFGGKLMAWIDEVAGVCSSRSRHFWGIWWSLSAGSLT